LVSAIYARQSVEKVDSVSIDAQISRCKAVCALNGWPCTVYSDTGFSGKNLNRPNFERLLCDIRAGKISALVSYKLDRISRSITDFAQLLQLFEQNGVQYISATEQFDTSSPVGRAMIYIVMVFAQLERETITQRVADNYRYRAAKGLYMGGGIPLGYRAVQIMLDGHKGSVLELDDSAAETVKKIFSLYSAGGNTHQIAVSLNNAGTLTARENRFTGNAILRILRNPAYCSNTPELFTYLHQKGYDIPQTIEYFDGQHGIICSCKSSNSGKKAALRQQIITSGQHKPIISAKDWIAVQNRLDEPDAINRPKSSSRSFLAGLIKCGECGCSYGLKYTLKKSGSYLYYYRRGRAARGVSCCNNDLWVPAGALEPYLFALITTRAREKLKDCCVERTVIKQDAVTSLEREYLACKGQIDNLLDGVGKGNRIVDRLLADSITRLDKRCKALETQIAGLNKKQDDLSGNAAEVFSNEIRELPALLAVAGAEEKRRIAQAFVKQIQIFKDGTVTVEWLI
jgi:site-specific DNA recombinase